MVALLQVDDTRAHVSAVLGAPARWLRLPGRDTVSDTFRVGDVVVKLRGGTPFEAGNLGCLLHDVHGVLAPMRLAPPLLWQCYDGVTMASAFGHVPHDGRRSDPYAVGVALARAHQALARVPGRTSEPWVGCYGEYHEFAMTTPAVADAEVRELGLRLLPFAHRDSVPGPHHYVHRDLHPANVIVGERGPCLIDWDLAHVGSAVDDLAMTACMWAAESSQPWQTTADVLAGYGSVSAESYTVDSPAMRTAMALAGLRQGVAAWFTDQGDCTAPYWPFVRRRMRVAAELVGSPIGSR